MRKVVNWVYLWLRCSLSPWGHEMYFFAIHPKFVLWVPHLMVNWAMIRKVLCNLRCRAGQLSYRSAVLPIMDLDVKSRFFVPWCTLWLMIGYLSRRSFSLIGPELWSLQPWSFVAGYWCSRRLVQCWPPLYFYLILIDGINLTYITRGLFYTLRYLSMKSCRNCPRVIFRERNFKCQFVKNLRKR